MSLNEVIDYHRDRRSIRRKSENAMYTRLKNACTENGVKTIHQLVFAIGSQRIQRWHSIGHRIYGLAIEIAEDACRRLQLEELGSAIDGSRGGNATYKDIRSAAMIHFVTETEEGRAMYANYMKSQAG